MPIPEREHMAKDDPRLRPTPPPASAGREQPGLPSMTGTGQRHHAVNTLAPTPVQIPDDPAERALYFAALHGTGGAQPRTATAGGEGGQEQPRNAADALVAELKRQAAEKAKQQPPRERDDDRGKDRDR
jgi:hypothetical protein